MARSIGKIRKERGDRWYIELPGTIRIYCDKNHRAFYSKQHAEWVLARIQGEIENQSFDASFYSKTRRSIYSFEVFAEDWMKICERRVQLAKWSRCYFKHVRHYVRDLFIPFFGMENIAEIKGKRIHQLFMTLEQSPRTVVNIMRVLHKMFQDAYDQEVIQQLPKFPVEMRESELPESIPSWADEETQDAIFECLDNEVLFFVLFLACHGVRPGEARALQHGDIDLKNGRVTICRAFSDYDLRHTKTKRIRTLPLDDGWKAIYESLPRCINPREFVFLRNGKPFSRTYAWEKWRKACDLAGVGGLTLYAGTRHSFASQAANRGVSLYLIGKFLGHSKPQTTEQYAHLQTDSLRQVQRRASVKYLSDANRMQRGFAS